MKVFSVLLLLLMEICIFHNINSFIIPDELPSILSVIYSNIPTIKKGTDSRLGWGFRLGNRADFQVLVELGPQTNTQPLANQNSDTNRNNKRDNVDSLANLLYAQRQHDKKKIISNTNGGKWLEQWSNEINSNKKSVRVKPGLGIGEIDAKSVIPDDKELNEIRRIVVKVPDMAATVTPSNVLKELVSEVTPELIVDKVTIGPSKSAVKITTNRTKSDKTAEDLSNVEILD